LPRFLRTRTYHHIPTWLILGFATVPTTKHAHPIPNETRYRQDNQDSINDEFSSPIPDAASHLPGPVAARRSLSRTLWRNSSSGGVRDTAETPA
jgi:hypothetical protein